MTVVDASVWVSSLVDQDAHHAPSRRWLEDRMRQALDVIVPTLTLAEVAGAVSRRTGRADLGRRAAAHILAAPGLRLISLDRDLGEEAARLASDRRLRGADAVYVAAARLLGAPLLTLDREIHDRAGDLITVMQL